MLGLHLKAWGIFWLHKKMDRKSREKDNLKMFYLIDLIKLQFFYVFMSLLTCLKNFVYSTKSTINKVPFKVYTMC